MVSGNGLAKSKLQWQLNPMMGRGCNCGVGALKDAYILSHISCILPQCCTFMCIPCHQYYPCNKLQVHLTPKCLNSFQACHTKCVIVQGETQSSLFHPPILKIDGYLPTKPCGSSQDLISLFGSHLDKHVEMMHKYSNTLVSSCTSFDPPGFSLDLGSSGMSSLDGIMTWTTITKIHKNA